MSIYSEKHALKEAILLAQRSPCFKSQRGVVVFRRGKGYVGGGFNAPPKPFVCGRNIECTRNCNKLCVHAEQAALLDAERHQYEGPDLELLHVKAVLGHPVPSGPPSCWQCSRLILERQVGAVWLLHEDGLRSYTAAEFHEATLRTCGLPIFGGIVP